MSGAPAKRAISVTDGNSNAFNLRHPPTEGRTMLYVSVVVLALHIKYLQKGLPDYKNKKVFTMNITMKLAVTEKMKSSR